MDFKIVSAKGKKIVADESTIESLKNYLDGTKPVEEKKKLTKSMKQKVLITKTCKHCFSDNKVDATKTSHVCDTCGNKFDFEL